MLQLPYHVLLEVGAYTRVVDAPAAAKQHAGHGCLSAAECLQQASSNNAIFPRCLEAVSQCNPSLCLAVKYRIACLSQRDSLPMDPKCAQREPARTFVIRSPCLSSYLSATITQSAIPFCLKGQLRAAASTDMLTESVPMVVRT